MPATLQELGVDKWSLPDIRRLYEDLYQLIEERDGVEPEPEVEFTEWEKRLIDERLGPESHEHPVVGYTWEEVKAQVWGK
jgi:hypothetical protein